MNIDFVIAVFITVVGASTPILFAGLGELVTEKSGVLNLGVEGMMLIGAIAGFATVDLTGNPWLAVLVAAAAGAAVSMIFAVLTLTLSANQVATGLALTIFGTGLSTLVGQGFTGHGIPIFGSIFPPALASAVVPSVQVSPASSERITSQCFCMYINPGRFGFIAI